MVELVNRSYVVWLQTAGCSNGMMETYNQQSEMSVFMTLKLKKRGRRRMVLVPEGAHMPANDLGVEAAFLTALIKPQDNWAIISLFNLSKIKLQYSTIKNGGG